MGGGNGKWPRARSHLPPVFLLLWPGRGLTVTYLSPSRMPGEACCCLSMETPEEEEALLSLPPALQVGFEG